MGYPNPEGNDLNPSLIEAGVRPNPEGEEPFELAPPRDNSGEIAQAADVPRSASFAEILFEQLEYLIQYPNEERDRLNRVAAALLETFN